MPQDVDEEFSALEPLPYPAPVDVRAFGAVGDGVTDDWQAFEDALTAADAAIDHSANDAAGASTGTSAGRNPTVYVPRGQYYLSDTLHIKRIVQLIGEGGRFHAVTELIFPDEVPGIIFDYYADNYDAPVDGGRGDGSILRGIGLLAQDDTDTSAHGIQIRCNFVTVEDFAVHGFGGNGVHIVASTPDQNANLFTVRNGTSYRCKNGVYTDGVDANAGTVSEVDASLNREWGIYDSSFLGNTYIGCHTANNGSSGAFGGYKTDGGVNSSHFIACYSESGQGAENDLNAGAMVFGGYNMTNEGNAATLGSDGTNGIWRSSPLKTPLAGAITADSYTTLGSLDAATDTALETVHPDADTWTLEWISDTHLSFVHNRSGSRRAIQLSGTGATEGAGEVRFPNGFHIAAGAGQRKVFNGATAPASGTWKVGDIVFNTSPTAGGTVGWVCTTAGTPGTWKTFGTIAA